MKAYKETVRKYYKYIYSDFIQPTLTENGNFNGDKMAVYCETADGGYRGDFSNPYRAFEPSSSPYYIGIGRNDERQSTLDIHIYNPNPLKITGYSFYFPGYETESDWGGFGEYWLYGSNNNSSWTQLDYGTDASRKATTTRTVSTNNFYKYYMLRCKTKGGGHRDGLDISQIQLFAQEQEIIESTIEDYDFYEDIDAYKLYTYPVFDRSKFTVVGSPTITDDGIASGFSNGYVKNTTNFTSINNFYMELCFVLNSFPTNSNGIILVGDGYSFQLGIKSVTNDFYITIGDNGTSFFDILRSIWSNIALNTKYFIKFGFNNGQYYIDLSVQDKNNYVRKYTSEGGKVINPLLLSSFNMFIGNSPNLNRTFDGSIDLSQFSITVDGVEVFNGTKLAYKAFNI